MHTSMILGLFPRRLAVYVTHPPSTSPGRAPPAAEDGDGVSSATARRLVRRDDSDSLLVRDPRRPPREDDAASPSDESEARPSLPRRRLPRRFMVRDALRIIPATVPLRLLVGAGRSSPPPAAPPPVPAADAALPAVPSAPVPAPAPPAGTKIWNSVPMKFDCSLPTSTGRRDISAAGDTPPPAGPGRRDRGDGAVAPGDGAGLFADL